MKLVCCDCYRGDSAAKQRDSGALVRAVGEISLHTQQGVGLHVIAPVKSGWFASVMTAAEQRMSLLWDNTKLDQKTGRHKSPNFLTQGKYSVPRHLHYGGTLGAGKFTSTHTHPFVPSKEHRAALQRLRKQTSGYLTGPFTAQIHKLAIWVGLSSHNLPGQVWAMVIFQSRPTIFIMFSSSLLEDKRALIACS